MEDKKILNDAELENVTGGAGTAIDGSVRDKKNTGEDAEGGICPLNGKHCKHGRISLSGECHHVVERIESTKTYKTNTFYECRYINDQV